MNPDLKATVCSICYLWSIEVHKLTQEAADLKEQSGYDNLHNAFERRILV